MRGARGTLYDDSLYGQACHQSEAMFMGENGLRVEYQNDTTHGAKSSSETN